MGNGNKEVKVVPSRWVQMTLLHSGGDSSWIQKGLKLHLTHNGHMDVPH